MKIYSVLEKPEILERAIAFFQEHWAPPENRPIYDDCLRHSARPVPQWYLLMEGEDVFGGVGLISNDFISRQDLYPWLCALWVEPEHRGKGYSRLLIERVKADARAEGFPKLYLATDHIGYYEKFGFLMIGTGYHPGGDTSRIYAAELQEV